MCVCVRELLREIDRTFNLQTLRSVSASLHLTPLIIAAREKRYNFPPRHYTLAPDRILRFFCIRSDSPFNSRSSFLQLADRFPATHVYFASNWLESSTNKLFLVIHIQTSGKSVRIEGEINHAREINLHFSIEPARPSSGISIHPQDTCGQCRKRFTLRLISIYLVTVLDGKSE